MSVDSYRKWSVRHSVWAWAVSAGLGAVGVASLSGCGAPDCLETFSCTQPPDTDPAWWTLDDRYGVFVSVSLGRDGNPERDVDEARQTPSACLSPAGHHRHAEGEIIVSQQRARLVDINDAL
jgi:hypothetical protein